MGKKQKQDRKHYPVSKDHLAQWRDRMGYTPRDCAKELGCTVAEWRDWESGAVKIPRYIGLACSALALDMRPYGEIQG